MHEERVRQRKTGRHDRVPFLLRPWLRRLTVIFLPSSDFLPGERRGRSVSVVDAVDDTSG
jgi:hypothetical protein